MQHIDIHTRAVQHITHDKLYGFSKTLLSVFLILIISSNPLLAQKKTIKYSDKNMQWIISRLNTKLTFEEFSKQFAGAKLEATDAITATASLKGQVYHYKAKKTHYYVYVNEQHTAKYTHAYSFDAKVRNKLLKLPIYDHKKRDSYNTIGFNHLKNAYYLDGSSSSSYLFWGDEANKLLIRMSADFYRAEDISVMVNGWYNEGNVSQWKGIQWDGINTLPMDFEQLQNLEELQRPDRERVQRIDKVVAAWKRGETEDFLDLDLSSQPGLCLTGCDDPNGTQEIFYPTLYYQGPVKNGLPHGEAKRFCLLYSRPENLKSKLIRNAFDYKDIHWYRSKHINFSEGKAVGKAQFHPDGMEIGYENGKAVYARVFPTENRLKVLDADGYIEHITGPLKNGKWSEGTEFHTFDPDSSKVYYKGEVNEAFEAHGKGTFYEYYIPASEESKVSYKQKSKLKATVAATWGNGEISNNHLATLKSYTWTFSGIGIDLNIKNGVASGEKITVIRNETPEYRGTGKMTSKPCPTGTWTLEKLNSETNEYESSTITDEYIVEGGYCMFKGSFDESSNKVDNVNLFKRQDYMTPEARKVLIAKQKQEQEEADRLKAIASKKRLEEEQQREWAILDNFERLLKKAVGSNAKIASEGWMTNFLDGETTGTAGLFIINTNKSSKSFSGKVSYSHPTNGSEEKDITLRVGGAGSSGYGGAYTSFNLGYGSPYQLKLKLNGNTSGVYYFIYYKGLLIK